MFYLSGLFHLVLPDLQKSVPKVYRLVPLSNTQNFKCLIYRLMSAFFVLNALFLSRTDDKITLSTLSVS